MKTVIMIMSSWLLAVQGFAAGPITHIYLADRWVESGATYKNEEMREFIIGNLFPDIRYLGEISREDTHEEGVTLDDIDNSNSPFLAGKRLHAYVDVFREACVEKWGVYNLVREFSHGHNANFLKLIEDEILYDRIWPEFIIACLDELVEDEVATGVSTDCLLLWHLGLQTYFAQRPSQMLAQLAETGKGLYGMSPQTIAEWSELLPILAQQEELIQYVDDLSLQFNFAFHQQHK
jgi:hypothetical protein